MKFCFDCPKDPTKLSTVFLLTEKQFKQNIDGVENCTQSLLINEKKKLKSLQKEFDQKNENYEQVSLVVNLSFTV